MKPIWQILGTVSSSVPWEIQGDIRIYTERYRGIQGGIGRCRVLVGAVEEPHALVARLGVGLELGIGIGEEVGAG